MVILIFRKCCSRRNLVFGCIFDPNGDVRFTLGTGGAGTIAKGTHPKDAWFKIKVVANMTDNNWEAFIDDVSLDHGQIQTMPWLQWIYIQQVQITFLPITSTM
ncbi:MAG: hypothetical protein IPI96_15240 [Saprospiraceae bacterium]|nr:hypothetical protein [Saprospiraceae bacterium]